MRIILLVFLVVMGLGVVAQQPDSSSLYMLHKSSQRIVEKYPMPVKIRVELKTGEVLDGNYAVMNDSSIVIQQKTISFSNVKSINRKIVVPKKYRLFVGSENQKDAREMAIGKFRKDDDSLKRNILLSNNPGGKVFIGYDLSKLVSPALLGFFEIYSRKGPGFSIEYGYKFFEDKIPFQSDIRLENCLKAISPAYRLSFGPQCFFRPFGSARPFMLGVSFLYKYQYIHEYIRSHTEPDYIWPHEYFSSYKFVTTVYAIGLRVGRPSSLKTGVSWFFDLSIRSEKGQMYSEYSDYPEQNNLKSFSNIYPCIDFTLIHYLRVN